MKKLILLLCLLAQYSFAAPFKITGRVDSPKRNYVVVSTKDYLSGTVTIDTVLLKQERFSYSISSNGLQFLHLSILLDSVRKLEITGYPGHQLHIFFPEAPLSPVFTGSLAKIQQYTPNDQAYWKKIHAGFEARNPNFQKKEFLRSDFYFTVQDSITQERMEHLLDYFKGKKLPVEHEFIEQRKLGFIYSNLFYKQSYPNPPFQKFKFYQTLFNVHADGSYRYSDLVDFDTPGLIHNAEYRRFVCSFLLSEVHRRRTKQNLPFSFTTLVSQSFALIDELSKDPTANYLLKMVFTAYLVDDVERSKQAKLTEELFAGLKLSGLKQSPTLVAIYARLTHLVKFNKFKKGSMAPDFNLLDSSNATVKLADFKGKRIVIDIAASWCGPCIAGIPAWNKMVSENKDPNTIFIFLSLDNTKKESLSLFNTHRPLGKLLYAGDGGFASEFAKNYQISILPHKIIIDGDGKIESYFY